MEKLKEQRIAFNKVYSERQGLYLAIIQKAGLPEIPYRILYAICEEEPGKLSQMDICHIWNFPKQSVNTAINRLIKLGYVTLSQDRTAARNRKIIELTDTGKIYCKTWVYPLVQADLKAFGTLSAQERDMYIDFVARQRDSLRKSLANLFEIEKQ
jgi:DNA-binding MarR family transcriptional regulator